MPMSTHGAAGGMTGPATNLNIGMDYWGGPTASPMPLLSGKVPAISPRGAVIPTGLVGPRDPSEHWVHVYIYIFFQLKSCEVLNFIFKLFSPYNAHRQH